MCFSYAFYLTVVYIVLVVCNCFIYYARHSDRLTGKISHENSTKQIKTVLFCVSLGELCTYACIYNFMFRLSSLMVPLDRGFRTLYIREVFWESSLRNVAFSARVVERIWVQCKYLKSCDMLHNIYTVLVLRGKVRL